MTVVALVCARGGSKGIPGKNLRTLGGRPLITWAIESALGTRRVSRVIVSTDSEEVAVVARAAGADVPFLRPASLAQDESPEWLVWRHALGAIKQVDGVYPDALLVVPPTAPLRAVADLDRCLDEFKDTGADIVITVTAAHRSPYYNMVRARSDGTVGLVIPPDRSISRRQDVPPVFDMTTVAYVADPAFVMEHDGLFDGRVRAVHVDADRALDIDTPLDLRIAECLLASR